MTPPKEMIYFVKCLAGVRHGEDLLKSGNDDLAEEWFHKTLDLANSAPPEISRDLVPYTLCFLSLAYQKRGLVAKSRESRERSTKLLDSSPDHLESTFFQTSMAEALSKLKDYRRAIPFWEKALASAEHEQDAQSLAGMLHQLGVCYCRIGLKEHAMVPLRAALKILESCPEHPLLPGVLLTLGNALRKSAPYEAERYYSETARIYSSRFQYESATPAWTNLAILFSEQGRHAESLELHERVLRVRGDFSFKDRDGT
jgi:tetratricopeptide (TPR) repeat protein